MRLSPRARGVRRAAGTRPQARAGTGCDPSPRCRRYDETRSGRTTRARSLEKGIESARTCEVAVCDLGMPRGSLDDGGMIEELRVLRSLSERPARRPNRVGVA